MMGIVQQMSEWCSVLACGGGKLKDQWTVGGSLLCFVLFFIMYTFKLFVMHIEKIWCLFDHWTPRNQ